MINTIAGSDVGWAYGAMLYEINRLSWSYAPATCGTSGSQVPFYVTLVVCIVLALMVLGLAFSLYRSRKLQDKERDGYLDLDGGERI